MNDSSIMSWKLLPNLSVRIGFLRDLVGTRAIVTGNSSLSVASEQIHEAMCGILFVSLIPCISSLIYRLLLLW